ncbi:MAG: asparagine synthase (glutamine-hydrolyzing) [Gemmataceae bacterium]
MCGVAGHVWKDPERPANQDVVEAMCQIMFHRGPDGGGVYADGPVALGHRRLAILDLTDAGAQPMVSNDGRYVITFNGEIYNYVELREQLRQQGCRFHTQTDTEVILEAYRSWGADCVQRFNGMWAFVILDRQAGELFLSRDRIGIKPLYYSVNPAAFLFASEIKALLLAQPELRSPRLSYVARSLASGAFNDSADTHFRNIQLLLPAHNARYRLADGSLQTWCYWSVNPEEFAQRWLRGDPVSALRELIESAIRLHVRADVPVGTCLSGGVDSSTVVGWMSRLLDHPVHTYSGLYPDPACNEEFYVDLVNRANNAIAGPVRPEPNGTLVDDLESITWHQDVPTAGPGLITQFHVMRRACQDVKVVLDGQGCDELFAGYLFYFATHFEDLLKERSLAGRIRSAWLLFSIWRLWGMKMVPAGVAPKILGNLPGRLLARAFRSAPTLSGFDLVHPGLKEFEASDPIQPTFTRVLPGELANLCHQQSTCSSLPALLHYEDRNSMAFSIEARVPFLDYRIVEFALALPSHWKIHGSWTKYVLRRAAAPVLPRQVTWRRSKMGYPTPMDRWLRNPNEHSRIHDLLFSSSSVQREYLDPVKLRAMWQQQLAGQDHSWALYRALTLELWSRMFIDQLKLDSPNVARPSPRYRRSA